MGFSPECLRTVVYELFLLATVDDELGEKVAAPPRPHEDLTAAVGTMPTWPCVQPPPTPVWHMRLRTW